MTLQFHPWRVLARRAWLVLADLFAPGWRATVDGRRVAVCRADAAFRAVRVPGGSSKAEFRYAPVLFAAGLPASAVSASLAFLLPAAGRRRVRRPARSTMM